MDTDQTIDSEGGEETDEFEPSDAQVVAQNEGREQREYEKYLKGQMNTRQTSGKVNPEILESKIQKQKNYNQ